MYTIDTSDRDRDILITAIEGGINYWAAVQAYEPDKCFARIIDTEDEQHRHPVYNITDSIICLGLFHLVAGTVKVNRRLLQDIVATFENNECEVDAEGADCIIQAGLFNEIRYS